MLLGVLVSAGEPRALIRSPAAANGHWLPPGAVIDGWTLERIEATRAVLTASGRTHVLQLYPGEEGAQPHSARSHR